MLESISYVWLVESFIMELVSLLYRSGSPNVSDQPTIDVIPRKRWKWTCRIFVAFCVIAGIAAIAFLLLHIFVNSKQIFYYISQTRFFVYPVNSETVFRS